MTNKSLLTASHVRYLMALKRLHNSEGIRNSELADELNLSRPSVHHMMNNFVLLEYIEKDVYGQVFLTEYGYQKASFFEEYYQKIKMKLFPMHVSDISVERAICAMMAELTEERIRCLA